MTKHAQAEADEPTLSEALERLDIRDNCCSDWKPVKCTPATCPEQRACVEAGKPPHCECHPVPRRCKHVDRLPRNINLRWWARALAQAASEFYLDPPPPVHPLLALEREARADLLAKRHPHEHLWGHPDDLDPQQKPKLDRELGRYGNMRPKAEGLRVAGTPADAPRDFSMWRSDGRPGPLSVDVMRLAVNEVLVRKGLTADLVRMDPIGSAVLSERAKRYIERKRERGAKMREDQLRRKIRKARAIHFRCSQAGVKAPAWVLALLEKK